MATYLFAIWSMNSAFICNHKM